MENKTISQETKPFHWFTQRLEAYGADLELAKFIVDTFIEKSTDGGKLFDLFKVAKEKYPYVSRHNNSKKERRNVGHHLRGTLHVAFVKELYEDFVEYISSILRCAAHAGIQPERFVGTSMVNVSIVEILKLGSWDSLVSDMSDRVFRSLEDKRDTKKLLKGMDERLGLKLNQLIVNGAMPYLESRHILVHRDGKPDKDFKKRYPMISIRLHNNKEQILVNFHFIKNAKEKVYKLAQHIDEKLIENNLIRDHDLRGAKQPQNSQ